MTANGTVGAGAPARRGTTLPLRSRLVDDEANVLAGVDLPDGLKTATIRFADDVWRFRDLALTRSQENNLANIYWDRVASPASRLGIKEYAWLRLNADPEVGGPVMPAGLQTASREAWMLTKTLRDMSELTGVTCYARATQADFDAWLARLRESLKSRSVFNRICAIQSFAGARALLTAGAPAIMPWPHTSASELAGSEAQQENVTPEIPTPVLTGFVSWAERYVVEFAPTITAAVRAHVLPGAERRLPGMATGQGRAGVIEGRLLHYVEHLRATGAGFPTGEVKRPKEDSPFFAAAHQRRRTVVTRPIWYATTGFESPPHGWERMLPWAALLDELGTDVEAARRADPESLVALRDCGLASGTAVEGEAYRLVTACLVVVLYYSGMRLGEALELPRECAALRDSIDGLVQLPVLRGSLHKGKGVAPEPHEWTTLEIAHDAVAALQALHDAYGSGADRLFAMPVPNPGAGVPPSPKRVWTLLDQFRDHVNRLAARSTRTASVPEWQGAPWTARPQQFRETLARDVGRAPGGVIAGAIQYGHRRPGTFEGYSGRAAEALAEDAEAAREVAQMDYFQELYRDFERGVPIGGPKGAELAREFDAVQREVKLRAVSDAELRDMLKHRLKTVYAGPLNYCFYDPKRALCRPRGDGTGGPLLAACRPDRCANSAFAKEHRAAWQWHFDDLDARLRDRRALPVLQQQVLTAERERTRAVLAEIDGRD